MSRKTQFADGRPGGGRQLAIAVDNSQVIIVLDEPAKNIWMSPDQARQVARVMIEKADLIQGKGSKLIIPRRPGEGI